MVWFYEIHPVGQALWLYWKQSKLKAVSVDGIKAACHLKMSTNQLVVSLWLDFSSFVSNFILNWRSIAVHWWVVFEFQKSFAYNCIICSILYIENFQKQEVI